MGRNALPERGDMALQWGMENIVVGFDGSVGSVSALRWAATEAGRHDARLTVLTAEDDHLTTCEHDEVVEHTDTWAAAAGLDRVDVTTAIARDGAVAALLRASQWADLVVVGSRGRGGARGALLGSVSTSVAEHAACPVAVVRQLERPTGPVVVGIDATPWSEAALQWAAHEARVRGVPLEIVHTYDGLALPTVPFPIVLPLAAAADSVGGSLLTRAIASADLAGVAVHTRPVHAPPATALIEASMTAGVVVVGTHGRGELGALVLGSVSRDVLHHADAPVVVVHEREEA